MNIKSTVPIVLMPGMTGTAALLAGLAGELKAARPVQIIDYPMTGPQDYDFLTQFVVDRLPRGPFILLAESFSGPIAIEIAAREQARTKGLILAATFARHPLPASLAPFAYWIDISMIPHMMIEPMMLGPYGTDELKQQFSRAIHAMPSDTVRARTQETLNVDKRRLLGDIRCPALCLTGRHDRLIPTERADEIIAGLTHCQHHAFDAPHMFLETHPHEAATVINAFCASLSVSGTMTPMAVAV
jgi:pimeloyl-[acyl-carrier protein] methyl ester esterase